MKQLQEVISEERIFNVLSDAAGSSRQEAGRIIDKGRNLQGLSPKEAAVLLTIDEEDLRQLLLQAAREVKEQIYGKRLVIFAPLYLDNICHNSCLYCGFRKENQKIERRRLSMEEIKKEVSALQKEGHKRLLILTGEKRDADLDYLLDGIAAAYQVQTKKGGQTRRINVEVAPMTDKEFESLAEANIGTYTCFQETYHRPTYKRMHPRGRKADFDWRLTVMDRAQRAGIDDVGIGALFGLYDYRYEVVAMLLHAQYLSETYGVGPHTVSVPRLQPAAEAPIRKSPYPISDEDFKKLVAVLRLAIPYTGIILSTREPVSLRNQLFMHGVSQISVGSRTAPGAYQQDEQGCGKRAQFTLHDSRPMSEVVAEVAKANYIPSFCTACYREGRTGEAFMDLAIPGKISNYCKPNAMLTFKEYLTNYADEVTTKAGEACLNHHLREIKSGDKQLAQWIERAFDRMQRGERDIYL